MKNTRTRNLILGAVIAALYVILTLLQDYLLPGTTSLSIQFRVAEALCILTLFTPSAIWALSLGCLLFNLTSGASLPLDWLVGTTATALSAITMYHLRKIKVKKLPLLSLFIPAAINGILVGAELTIYMKGSPMWLNVVSVAVGESLILFTLGIGLYFALLPVKDRLFGKD